MRRGGKFIGERERGRGGGLRGGGKFGEGWRGRKRKEKKRKLNKITFYGYYIGPIFDQFRTVTKNYRK